MQCVIGLGSNLGSRHALILAGLELLRARSGCRIERVSPCYESDPVGPPQPRYLNSAARIESPLGPSALLAELHAVENCFGRTRQPGLRFGPRTLDLDLLWASTSDHGPAAVPHPRLEQRWFCLRPLLNVAHDLAPVYADKLLQLPLEALEVRLQPVALTRTGTGSLETLCEASDQAEALAGALTALLHALNPSPRAAGDDPLRVAGTCTPGVEAACLIAAVADAIRRESPVHSVVVTELAEGRYSGFLTLAQAPRTPNACAFTLEAVDVHERAVRIRAKPSRSRMPLS